MLIARHIPTFLDRDLGGAGSDHALAYIGPGGGLGGIAIVIALCLGLLFLVVGLVWYPLKRMLNGRREGAANGGRTDEPT